MVQPARQTQPVERGAEAQAEPHAHVVDGIAAALAAPAPEAPFCGPHPEPVRRSLLRAAAERTRPGPFAAAGGRNLLEPHIRADQGEQIDRSSIHLSSFLYSTLSIYSTPP